jgi:branched-chain amino acid transport system substrate-binding protein
MRQHPSPRSRRRAAPTAAVACALALIMTACGNAHDNNGATGTSTGGPVTTFTGHNFSKHVTVDAPGVTANEIHVGSITSKTNPLGNDASLLNDGIEAYFNVVNASGGVWGRKLKLTSTRDDQTANNATETEALLAQDNVYAAFEASVLFTGASKLAAAGIPTFGWNINAEWAGPKNFFPNVAPICFAGCSNLTHILPWAVHQSGAHRVGVLAYNVAQSSDAMKGAIAAIQKFGRSVDARLVFSDLSLQFGQTDFSAQVAQLKAKHVDFLVTGLDFNGDYAVAKEMQRQGIVHDVTFLHPNLYNAEFVRQHADVFDGGIVLAGILAAEHTPAPPALQQYLDYARTHNVAITEMTEQGWLAARQFVEALKAAGPNFTWANLVSAWNQQQWFTNGGLAPPIDWRVQHNDPSKGVQYRSPFECANFVRIKNGRFVGIWDDGGTKPFVCANGRKPEERQTPVNVSFDGKPFEITDVLK